MKLTVWGARGSTPVSGPEYIRHGGDTTCVCLETAAGETIILDAGSGIRALGKKLLTEGQRTFHLVLSHAHWDHLLGFPFFKPLYRKDTTILIHGCTYAQDSIRMFLRTVMQPPFFPVNLEEVQASLVFDEECKSDISIGSIRCMSMPLSHPNQGYGFRMYEGDKSVGFFPDNELSFPHPGGKTPDEYAEFVRGIDVLIHDAEYLPEESVGPYRGWGHSNFLDTVRMAVMAQADRLVLWHLNQDRTDDALDEMAVSAQHAAEQAGSSLQCIMARTGLEIEV